MVLNDIAVVDAGYPFRGTIPETLGSHIAAVQMKDVSLQEGINWSGCTRTTLTGKRAPDWLQPGDILIAARGSHNYAVHVDERLTSTDLQAVAAPHFFIIRVTREEVLPEFLTWLLNQAPCQRYFEQTAEGSVTKSIRRSVLEQTPVAMPPLDKQRIIIRMNTTLARERRIATQLVNNGAQLMNTIASELLAQPMPR